MRNKTLPLRAIKLSSVLAVTLTLAPVGWAASNYQVLHAFGSEGDGGNIWSGVVLDKKGNLYGTTSLGGANYRGTVFRLTRQPNGHWKETILHSFKLGRGGNRPAAGVAIDPAGNLYGVTGYGGTDCDCGVVYKLVPNPDSTWTYMVLHRFAGSDGYFPYANPVLDEQGNLYGTTMFGGSGGGGAVFKITP